MPPVLFAVQSYRSRSLPLSAQRLVNFFAEQAPRDAKSPVVVMGTPGIKAFSPTVGNGPIRGMHVMEDVLYVLSGNVFYSISELGVAIALGSISSAAVGSATASFTITGGSVDAGVNTVSSITINGVELLSGAIDFTTDASATAALIVTQINTSPTYTATSSGATITISAVQTGAGSNGYQMVVNTDGDVTVG